MSYRDEVKVTTKSVHRIQLHRMGTTFVDVGFYPDKQQGTTNGSISVHGDFGPFSYFWNATGRQYFSDFLRGTRYDYAMTKFMGHRAYEPDWGTLPDKLVKEVLERRAEQSLSPRVARMLFDYFKNDTLETFEVHGWGEYRYALECEMTLMDIGRKGRRNMDWWGDEDDLLCTSPLEVLFGGDWENAPEPDHVRSEPYFWDEVWPVIVDEVAKLEHELAKIHCGEDHVADGA